MIVPYDICGTGQQSSLYQMVDCTNKATLNIFTKNVVGVKQI